jgi:hypothetical protein
MTELVLVFPAIACFLFLAVAEESLHHLRVFLLPA